MTYDPKYDNEHLKWNYEKNHTPHNDPLEEHLQYYTAFERQWMKNIEDILNNEPTLFHMENIIKQTRQYLEREIKDMTWWNEQAYRYYKRDDLLYQRISAKPYEKAKLSFEINRLNREIKKHGKGYSEEDFREKYDFIVEKHQNTLMYTEEIRVKMEIGINMWKHAAIREIYAKYPELRGTVAGKEIAPYLKQINEELGRDLTVSEIKNRYETKPNPEVKKLFDAFLKAESEIGLHQTDQSYKQNEKLQQKSELTQKNTQNRKGQSL